IVTFAMDAGPTPVVNDVTCADNGGGGTPNAYTKDADIRNGSGTSGVRTVVFSAPVTTALASGKTITVTFPSVTAKAVSVNEFSGLLTSGYVDQSGTSTGTSTAPSATTGGATAQIQELLIGAMGREGKSGEFSAVGSGYTALTATSSGNSGGSDTHITINPEYRVVTTAGTFIANCSLTTSNTWAAAIVTYRAVPTATPT